MELGDGVIGWLEFKNGTSMVVVKPVESGTVRTRVVFVLGVSAAMVKLDEGMMDPLALVALPELVGWLRL